MNASMLAGVGHWLARLIEMSSSGIFAFGCNGWTWPPGAEHPATRPGRPAVRATDQKSLRRQASAPCAAEVEQAVESCALVRVPL